ncbi:MAG TPA: hypothetical protein VLA67_02445 [Nitrospiraceae bacterium]|nr:hypothetical protein [Nitrospiraceae bacterium]
MKRARPITLRGVASISMGLTHIIHEDFYCNRRYAATTSLTAGGLAARSVNILFKYASLLRGSTRPFRVASRRFRHELL